MAAGGVPSGLLRQPGAAGVDLDAPLGDAIAQRNRYRRPSVRVEADGLAVEPVTSEDSPGVTVKRSRATEASHASVVGLADEKPREGELLSVYLNGTLVFGGGVNSAELNDAGILTVEGYDATRRLLRIPFSGSYDEASMGQVVRDVARNAGVAVRIANTFLSASQIAGDTPFDPAERLMIDETGTDALSGETTESSGGGGDGDGREYLTVTHDFENANSAQVLDDLAAAAKALWWVGPQNALFFTDTPQIETHLVNGITESQAGGRKIPYQKVVVIGSSKKPPEGERRRPRASKNTVRGVAGDESAPPAQTYRTEPKRAITTSQQAQNVADSVWEEIQRKRKSGTIRLAGRADVFPDDVVTLPPYYGNEQYLVKHIRHTIDSDKGFVSAIQCAEAP